jgi:hypothetical protein
MKNTKLGFAVAGSILTVLFLTFVNLTTSRGYLWVLYPAFAVLWWPLSVHFAAKGRMKIFSAVGSILIMAFLILVNMVHSPWVPWYLFTLLPVIWWPVTTLLGKRAAGLGFSLASFLIAVIYYGFLNAYVFPGHPWIIYVAYALIWWPMSVFFSGKRRWSAFSVTGTLLTIAFFLAVNRITTPDHFWAVYPIFAVLWWPLSMFCFRYNRKTA